MYMPGRLRTASRPFSTRIDSAPYSAACSEVDLRAGSLMRGLCGSADRAPEKRGCDMLICGTKPGRRLGQSRGNQVIEKMVLFGRFSRPQACLFGACKKADSRASERAFAKGWRHRNWRLTGRLNSPVLDLESVRAIAGFGECSGVGAGHPDLCAERCEFVEQCCATARIEMCHHFVEQQQRHDAGH